MNQTEGSSLLKKHNPLSVCQSAVAELNELALFHATVPYTLLGNDRKLLEREGGKAAAGLRSGADSFGVQSLANVDRDEWIVKLGKTARGLGSC